MIEGFWIGVGIISAKIVMGIIAILLLVAIATFFHYVFEIGGRNTTYEMKTKEEMEREK